MGVITQNKGVVDPFFKGQKETPGTSGSPMAPRSAIRAMRHIRQAGTVFAIGEDEHGQCAGNGTGQARFLEGGLKILEGCSCPRVGGCHVFGGSSFFELLSHKMTFRETTRKAILVRAPLSGMVWTPQNDGFSVWLPLKTNQQEVSLKKTNHSS